MEEWKEIKETDNRYSISSYGRVKKNKEKIVRSNGRVQTFSEKIIKPIYNNYGYLKVRCSLRNYNVKNISVHSLVARYFINKPPQTTQVNHINGIKTDNRVENLEWVTAKQNIQHAWANGLSKASNCTKISINGVLYDSINDAAKSINIDRNILSRYLKCGVYNSYKTRVVYDGVEYESIREASRKVGKNPKTILKYAQKTSIDSYVIKKI